MKQPFFSVIIPVLEINEFIIHETLPALQAQTYANFEVIVVPNSQAACDTQLIQNYSWLKIHPSREKTKPGQKRDLGATIASGSILAFIDDDSHPHPEWLKNAASVWHEHPQIVALGGPGILPKQVTFWEDIFDSVLTSRLGSGAYRYRFIPEAARFVDDYPAMNLMVKADVFQNVGGYKNTYWPGEDSKLLEKINTQHPHGIYYHPDVQVFHHRRASLSGHMSQYRMYGYMRGTFFAQGDKNSRGIGYLIPTFFTLYFAILLTLFLLENTVSIEPRWYQLMLLPLYLYLGILLITVLDGTWKKKKWYIFTGTLFVIPLTHVTYGTAFILGYMNQIRKNFSLTTNY